MMRSREEQLPCAEQHMATGKGERELGALPLGVNDPLRGPFLGFGVAMFCKTIIERSKMPFISMDQFKDIPILI